MYSRVFVCLIGALHMYFQVIAAVDEIYIAELMVESNITLQASTILSVFNSTDVLQVTDSSTMSHTVTLCNSELLADCLIVGDNSNCTCSTGYIWSNPVCYNYKCCRETPCLQNVSDITPLCIAKVIVSISGSLVFSGSLSTLTPTLQTNLGQLNGFEFLNVTGPRLLDNIVDFEANVSVVFPTSKLQTIINNLQTSLGVVIQVNTEGLVTIEVPNTVCYKSVPVLKCTFEEATGSAGWNLITPNWSFELNTGSVVKLEYNCSTAENTTYLSCTKVILQSVTGIWSGSYECGFTSGSVRHTAKASMEVILLPDVITLKIDPLSVDCKMSTETVLVMVTATILKTHEKFNVMWSYMNVQKDYSSYITDGDYLVYTFIANVSCQKNSNPHKVSVNFKNIMNQNRSEDVYIPVIYAGEPFCKGESDTNGDIWPNAPAGDTLFNITCAVGKVGFKSRTCVGTTWQPVFYYCVNKKLDEVLFEADNFLKGLNATQDMAKKIFSRLKNNSAMLSDPNEYMADVNVSINILNVMDGASKYFDLGVEVLPELITAASNMLNMSWSQVNQSVMHKMASNYLASVEGLVENIRVNMSIKNILYNQNVELKFCLDRQCNKSVFGIDLSLNLTKGILKTIAVKNLMNKLRNNFLETNHTSLLLSATVQDNKDSLQIRMQFPEEMPDLNKRYCVFWNTTKEEWSDEGCNVVPSNGNQTFCKCNHLTSFSVLMAKEDVSDNVLDIITYVGLGVSICSLLLFLTVEYLVWSAVVKSNLSHFRHTAIVNIATFLLLGDCCFLASPKGIGETWCLALTVCKHLLFLGMFGWMMCLSVMLVHQLIFVFSPLRKRVFMFLSSIAGYVCPILIVGSSYMYCKYTKKPYYNKDTCWLVFERLLEGSIHAFLLPVGTVIFTNLFSLVVVIITVVKSSTPEGSNANDKETAKGVIKLVVFLSPVFGLTWIIGFALLLLNKNNAMFTFANYSFTILNSFQGLFLLIVGCFAEQKVREEMLKIIMAKTKGKSESTNNLTSTTKDK